MPSVGTTEALNVYELQVVEGSIHIRITAVDPLEGHLFEAIMART
jgi:hypothetical protein